MTLPAMESAVFHHWCRGDPLTDRVGVGGVRVPRGYAHAGQVEAVLETSRPHSGQSINAMVPPVCRLRRAGRRSATLKITSAISLWKKPSGLGRLDCSRSRHESWFTGLVSFALRETGGTRTPLGWIITAGLRDPSGLPWQTGRNPGSTDSSATAYQLVGGAVWSIPPPRGACRRSCLLSRGPSRSTPISPGAGAPLCIPAALGRS